MIEQAQYQNALDILNECRFRTTETDNRVIPLIAKCWQKSGYPVIADIISAHELCCKKTEENSKRCEIKNYEQIEKAVDGVLGHLVPGQEKFLYEKVKSLADNAQILEIGGLLGRSSCAMAYACVGTQKRIITIDTFTGMLKGGTHKQGHSFLDVWRHNINQLGLSSYFTVMVGASEEVLINLGKRPFIDMVFIDGSHHYHDIFNDFKLVYPLVKDNGWIFFHDVIPDWTGPFRIWYQFAKKLLHDYHYETSIAGGRKTENKAWTCNEFEPFDYSLELIKHLETQNNTDKQLLYELTFLHRIYQMQQNDDANNSKTSQIEQKVASMPDMLKTTIKHMLSKEAFKDGVLHYWQSLILLKQGEHDNGLSSLKKAIELCPSAYRTILKNRLELDN
ncbi:MAG: class I SAM-dependent methyltransferase [Desulfamplus sp.]|nr:class I SAM-dependent methyltransferase [Desulfamplus sp.]